MEVIHTAIVGIYAIGGLVSIVWAVGIIVEILRKRKKITDAFTSDGLAIFATVVLMTALGFQYNSLTTSVPDGEYRVDIAVRPAFMDAPFLVPADVEIITDKEYEEHIRSVGAVEYSSANITYNRRFYCHSIYFGENEVGIDSDVWPGETVEIWLGDEELYLTLGQITPEILGVTFEDNWNRKSLLGKAEAVGIPLSCGLILLQYLKYDEKRKHP